MSEAMDRGRATLPLFVRAFRDPEPRWIAFQVRYDFETNAGYASAVWLELESISDAGVLVGRVPEDEDPRLIPFEPGERLEVGMNDVSDWMFIDERARWVGGYTLRVTMDRSLGTGVDPEDNIHGGTQFRDLDGPDDPDGWPDQDGS